jgi:uncharacterized membrane protein
VSADVAVRSIAQEVIDRIGIPHDFYEIAAQLEVRGIRDVDAREQFGCSDVFDLARRSYALFERGELAVRIERDGDEEPRSELRALLHDYGQALAFSLPMLLQGVTLLAAGFGLWGGTSLDIRIATAIALGFIASYIVTGGLCQAVVRRGLYYRYQNEGALARWTVWRMWRAAVRVALLVAVPPVVANLLLHLLPWDMVAVALLYYVALSVLWLNWSLVYLVERSWWFIGALVVALAAVVVAGRVFAWPVIAANMLGLVIAIALSIFIAARTLRSWATNGVTTTSRPPRFAVVLYGTTQVFLYGLLYSTFVFADRVVAWTTARGREDFPPYGFWLSARYELGLDFALVVVILLCGVVEYSARRFSARLVPEQKRVRGAAFAPFFDSFARLDAQAARMMTVGAIVACSVAVAVFLGARSLATPELRDNLLSTTTVSVFAVAVVGYALFMFALRNMLVLLTLSRSDTAVRIFGLALTVNVVVGYALSRSIHYSLAVVGFLFGSIVLLVASHRAVREVLGELDYYYYASF